jgi:hypothetical protein
MTDSSAIGDPRCRKSYDLVADLGIRWRGHATVGAAHMYGRRLKNDCGGLSGWNAAAR